jgi:ribosomal subunit interface protein
MRTEIRFTHMDRSEAVEEFASTRIEPVVEEFLGRDNCHIQIWLNKEHSPHQKGTPAFKCEVNVRFAPKREIFVHKTDPDMYAAISSAASSLQTVLRDESKKEKTRRHG